MKRLISLSIFLCGVLFSVQSQDLCRELFITEIIFGQDGSYSIEVFNPTGEAINLSSYKLQLSGNGTPDVNITFNGIVGSHETHVITKLGSNAVLTSVSDVLSVLLDFQGKSTISLIKNDTEILDKFGQNVQTTTSFDLGEFLNNPQYIDDIEIDLGSLESLLVRRKPAVQKGNSEFESSNLIGEWKVFPDFMLQDVGVHKNACVSAILNWADYSWTDPELEVEETYPWQIKGDIQVDGNLDQPVTIVLNPVFPEFSWIDYPDAASNQADCGFDYSCTAFDYLISASNSSQEIQISSGIIDDNELEGNEGAAFSIQIINDNGTGASVGWDYIWDMVIEDDETTSVDDLEANLELTIYPTLVEDRFNFKLDNNILTVKNIAIFSSQGKVIYPEFEGNTVILKDNLAKGYYTVCFQTSKGLVYQKFIKI